MTKDELINTIIESNKEMVTYIGKIDGTLKLLNDQNVLHSNLLQKNSDILKEVVTANKSTIKLFRWILIAVISALIVLSGAKQALEFLPQV